jgi:hypothetical protein
MSEYSKTALTWGGLKDALLYFSYVIALFEPEHLLAETASEARLLPAWEREFLPPDIPETAIKDLESLRESFWILVRHTAGKMAERYPPSSGRVESTENSGSERIVIAVDATVLKSVFNDAVRGELGADVRTAILSLFVHYKSCLSLPLICSSANTKTAKTSSDDVAVMISSLKLIDTRSVTMEQLLEIRQDAEAMEKLRRFRLFVYQNYQGKSKDYIEDDIQTRIADYDQAVKKWGFTTASGAITTLLNSSLIAGGVAGSFLTAYFNAPESYLAWLES